jgi:putative phosphoesterase
MRIAALYDVHANRPALEAVLTDVEQEHPDVIVIGGDVVWGPMPSETLDVLRSLDGDVRFLMGNADRDVFDRVEGTWKESNDWCADRLSEGHLSFLRSRPATISLDGILFCHGSPRSDLDPITIGTSEDQIVEWCAGIEENVVVCGHTHAQFDRTIGELRVVNAGSVGNPFGEPGAYWVLLDDAEVDLRFTSYDVEGAARSIRQTTFPYGPLMATQISTASSAEAAAAFFS